MNALRRTLRKLPLLVRRERFQSELEEEMALHREEMEQELRGQGASPEQARTMARRHFGDATRLREASVDAIAFRWESALQDVRYAVRQLKKTPGFTATVILILGLGIGASAAIYSAVNPILFKPLPYPAANRIMMLWEDRGGTGHAWPTYGTFYGMRERNRSFEYLAALKMWQPTMTGPFEPERFEGEAVTADFFKVLGTAPAMGRDFEPIEDTPNGPLAVILSDRLWRRRFGADRSIVGRQIKLDGENYTVAGVMPAGFENVMHPECELWTTLRYDLSQGRAWGHHLRMVGRVRKGVTAAQAKTELDAILKNLAHDYASGVAQGGGPSRGMLVQTLQADLTQDVKPALLAIMGAVVLLLAVACVNAANLLLARSGRRRGEFAVRAALGAARPRLIRQLLTESLLLAVLGGAVGFIIAVLGVRALVLVSPPDLPRLDAIAVDRSVYAFAMIVTTLVGLAVGIAPALHASRVNLHTTTQQASGRATTRVKWTRTIFVVAEVSIAVVLLVSAGLLLRSVRGLLSVSPGFDAANVLTMEVQTSGEKFTEAAATHRFFASALTAVQQVPGVQSAAFTNQVPLSGDYEAYGLKLEPDSSHTPVEYGVLRYGVTPDFFTTMKIPVLQGRAFNEGDREHSPRVAIVSDSFAKAEFPNSTPAGRRIQIGPLPTWFTIVGVVGTIKQSSLALDDLHQIYTPTTQWHWPDAELTLVVRSNVSTAALVPAIKRAIWSVDKDQPIVRVATMGGLLEASEAKRRFTMMLFEVFAFVALLLAATGMYGVLTGSVVERTHEIGVRVALGATPGRILRVMFCSGMGLTLAGVLIGTAGATIASRGLATLLFGISQVDAKTYFGVAGLMLSISSIACWLPAWRAARVNPAITLRAE